MLCHLRFALVFGALVAALGAAEAPQAPPKTRLDNAVDVLHGVMVPDRYRWLEDQDSPETRAWIDAQNQHTRSLIGSLAVRERISRRLGELMKIDTIGTPMVRGGRYFFTKRAADQPLAVVYARQGRGGKDEVLLDPHPLSSDHTVSQGLVDVSDDGKLVAYGTRQGGEDERVIEFLEVDGRRRRPDRLPKGRY